MVNKRFLMFLLTILLSSSFFAQTSNQFSKWKTYYYARHINSIAARGNDLWAGTNNGLAHINLETDEVKFYDRTNSGIKYGYVTSLYIRQNGDLIFSQGGNGVTYFNQYTWPSWGSMLAVTTIIEDKDYELWMGSPYGGIEKTYYQTNSPYAIGRFQWRTNNSPLPSDNIKAIQFDKKGNLWIAAFNYDFTESIGGVVKYDGQNWTIYNKLNSPISTNQISSLVLDKNDDVWIGTEKESVYKFSNDEWTKYDITGINNSPQTYNKVTALAVDSTNNLWVGMFDGGIYKYDGNDWKLFNGYNSKLRSNMIISLAVDYKGRVWVGTEIGLYRYENGDFNEINISNSDLPSANLSKSITDSKGNIWFISEDYGSPDNSNKTTNGIVRYDGSDFIFISTQEIESTSNQIQAITSDLNDNIWIATTGRLYKYNNGQITKYNYNNYFEFYPQSMCSDYAGNIWIGNSNGNIIKFDGVKFTTFSKKDDPLFRRSISSILADGVNVWVCFVGGGYQIAKINIARTNDKLIYETIDSPLDQITSAQLDKEGNLWAGSYNEGIAKYNGKNWKTYNTSNSEIMTNFIHALYVNENNKVIVANHNSFDPYNKGGLGILTNERWENFTFNNSGLGFPYIRSVTTDKNGNVWVICDGGVSIYNAKEVNLSWEQVNDNIENQLNQNFPNPFNSSTIIKYSLKQTSNVKLKIFDMLGREVKTIVDQTENEGNHFVFWDGRNNSGSLITSGVYIYTLITNEKKQAKKLILMK
ncbi:MAG: T9SS type A sorting domain-containing protein [Ignavibacteriales bacterium]|nr:T9SS type A sorting domain-containing protein [Ignavibacteriales bacterium]